MIPLYAVICFTFLIAVLVVRTNRKLVRIRGCIVDVLKEAHPDGMMSLPLRRAVQKRLGFDVSVGHLDVCIGYLENRKIIAVERSEQTPQSGGRPMMLLRYTQEHQA